MNKAGYVMRANGSEWTVKLCMRIHKNVERTNSRFPKIKYSFESLE